MQRSASQAGCRIDLDDFGTGFTSIVNIRRFNVSRIKIDRRLVSRLDKDAEQRRMVAALLSFSSKLGIEALADGVSPGSFVIALGLLCVIVPGVIFICIQMRRILLTLVEGDPFVPENAGRLSRIGIAIAAMEIIRIATLLVVRAMPSLVGDAPPKLSTQLILWISVAALFILSQVFREGTRLRDEEKMTI